MQIIFFFTIKDSLWSGKSYGQEIELHWVGNYQYFCPFRLSKRKYVQREAFIFFVSVRFCGFHENWNVNIDKKIWTDRYSLSTNIFQIFVHILIFIKNENLYTALHCVDEKSERLSLCTDLRFKENQNVNIDNKIWTDRNIGSFHLGIREMVLFCSAF